MDPQPSILFCLDFYWPHIGGGEVLFTGLAEGLARRGWKVRVLTQHLKDSPDFEVRHGVEIYRHWSARRATFSLASIPALCRLAREADIIHASTYAAAFPAWVASRLMRKPLVLTVHEIWIGKWNKVSDDGFWSNMLNDKLERLIHLFNYRNYIAVSEATARDMVACGIPSERIRVIHNGIDYSVWKPDAYNRMEARKRLGVSDDDFLFMYSGRPGCSKGFPYLLQALARIVKRYPQVILLARLSSSRAVQKDYCHALQMIEELGLSDHVRNIPPVPFDMIPPMTLSADTVVVPSLSEGFGFVAVEACAMKRPVIVSNTASLPEVVSGKVLRVPPRDVDALADAMERAIRQEWEEIPEKRFPISEMIDKHIACYREILGCPEAGSQIES